MPLKIGRRPYTDCPYRWILVVQGVATGVGDVTEDSCLSLNGRFKLDYRSCLSTKDTLVWATECLASGPAVGDRIRSRWFLEYHITDENWTLKSLRSIQYPTYELADATPCVGNEKTLTRAASSGSDTDGCDASPVSVKLTRSCPPERRARDHKRSTVNGQLKRKCGCDCNDEPDDLRYECSERNDGGDIQGNDCCPCISDIEWTVSGFVTPTQALQPENWPILRHVQSYPDFVQNQCLTSPVAKTQTYSQGWGDQSNSTYLAASGYVCNFLWKAYLGLGCNAGTCESEWYFSYYEVEVDPFSFPIETVIRNVTYKGTTPLSDGCGQSPITLALDVAGSSVIADCPAEITFNPANGCDIPMEIECGATYEEPPFNPDDCLYEDEGTVCCDYCDGMDQPCAYIAEFECDISNPDAVMSGYTVLAARQVVLRQECPFDETCEWVAVGPSSNPEDGGVGAQPVCATCDGGCPETGCTWQSWSVGACP